MQLPHPQSSGWHALESAPPSGISVQRPPQMCGKGSLGIWASHANYTGWGTGQSSPERGRLPLQRRMASEGSRQKSYEVKRGQAERPGEDGRTFPAVRSKAWRVGRDAAHGEGEGRTFKSLVPQSWPRKCTHREEGLEGEETEPVTAQASSRLCFECFSEGHEGCTVSGSFAIKPSHCIGVYTERWEIKMD